MRVDHGRANVLVAQKFLNSADREVLAVFADSDRPMERSWSTAMTRVGVGHEWHCRLMSKELRQIFGIHFILVRAPGL